MIALQSLVVWMCTLIEAVDGHVVLEKRGRIVASGRAVDDVGPVRSWSAPIAMSHGEPATARPPSIPAEASVRRPRAWRIALPLVGASFLLAVFAGAVSARQWLLTADSIAFVICAETVDLTPISRPGHPFAQHRHGLGMDGWQEPAWRPDADGIWRADIVVLNRRTGRAFRWGFRHTSDGRTEYSVPTRYALLANRDWRDEPWAFCRLAPANGSIIGEDRTVPPKP